MLTQSHFRSYGLLEEPKSLADHQASVRYGRTLMMDCAVYLLEKGNPGASQAMRRAEAVSRARVVQVLMHSGY
ncbi:hypothetical protein NQZ79_g1599 [Umbelopsis isabellina]|nr:hypothetical protein NQZ79_g1599 [Umbelopsis isabellina]